MTRKTAMPELKQYETAPDAAALFDAEQTAENPESAQAFQPPATDAPITEPPVIDWAQTLDEHQSWLRTVIAARVGEAQAVEEVFQEVSLAAIRQKAPIQDPAKVAPWLYRLAVIHSLLYRRKMGRKRRLLERYQEKVPVTEQDFRQTEPLEWLLAQERRVQVTEAIAAVPDNLRELLMLKYVHDWSYKEMAEKTGLTVSAVQARLHRARNLLRKRLAGTVGAEN